MPIFFVVPPGATSDKANYDVDNNLGRGSVWRVTVYLETPARIGLQDAQDLKVKSNNPNALYESFNEISQGNLRILTLKGKKADQVAMLEVGVEDSRTGLLVSKAEGVVLQVVVKASPQSQTAAPRYQTIELASPNLTLNSSDTTVNYVMDSSLVTTSTQSDQAIIDLVKAQSKLRHLVLSSHGESDVNKSPQVNVLIGGPGGTTFNIKNAEKMFSQLKTVVGGGVIWISPARSAGPTRGKSSAR